MQLIKKKFDELTAMYPHTGPFIVFGRTIEGRKYKERTVRIWFYKLLECPLDYEKEDIKELIESLMHTTNRTS
jgi:hypothetical protein